MKSGKILGSYSAPVASSMETEAATGTERALIAAILTEPARTIPETIKRGITAEDFTDAGRSDAFGAALALFSENEAVDAIRVTERLTAEGKPDAVNELYKAIEDERNNPVHAAGYMADIQRRAMRRRGRALLASGGEALANPSADPCVVLADVSASISSQLLSARGAVSFAEKIGNIVTELEELAEGRGRRSGAKLPTPGLSRALGVLEPGLHVLAAKTSAGKSTVEGAIVRNLALNGKRILRCFLDMGWRDLYERDIAALCFLDSGRIRRGQIDADERALLELAGCAMADFFQVEDMTAPTLGQIVSKARAMLADKGLDLVTVDFVQMVQTGNPKTDGQGNANARIGEVTRTLKAFALESGVPVLLLSQLNRATRDDAAPSLADLRDSGNIEQDARTVSFLFPDAAAVKALDPTCDDWRKLPVRPIWFSVAKNQQGRLGQVPLRMVCNLFSIEDAARNGDGLPQWDRPASIADGVRFPVVARNGNGVIGVFDDHFLTLVNRAAEKRGKPQFQYMEDVRGGIAAVQDRIKELRGRK